MSVDHQDETLKQELSSNENENSNTQLHHEMSEQDVAKQAARFGYGPLAKVDTAGSRLPAFGGEFQPGLYKPVENRKIANPAPLGLSAFALTTFLLSCINLGTRGLSAPNLVIGSAFGYGGLVQLCAGMWYVCCRCQRTLLIMQGNGRRKHVRCHRAVVLWWILDLVRHHLDPGRLPH